MNFQRHNKEYMGGFVRQKRIKNYKIKLLTQINKIKI